MSVRSAFAVTVLVAGPCWAQAISSDVVATMRATLVTGPQRVQLAGSALEPFRPLFRAAGREVAVMGETRVVSRTSQQPPCGRVNIRLMPQGITGKSSTGAVEPAYWDLAYDLCAEAGPAPDAIARGSPKAKPPAALLVGPPTTQGSPPQR